MKLTISTAVPVALWTNQEVFDFIVEHLRTQGRPAKKEDACMYLAPSGAKCAVGCLIPAELYHKDLEGLIVSDILGIRGKIREFIGSAHFYREALLAHFQATHDNFEPVEWEDKFREIADDFKLVYSLPACPPAKPAPLASETPATSDQPQPERVLA